MREIMKPYRTFVYLLLILCLFLSGCGNDLPIPSTGTEPAGTEMPATETDAPPAPTFDYDPTPDTRVTPIELQAGYGVRGSWFELYFTNPTSPLSPQGTGG